ncbi:DUF6894 family protein [Rhizobium sp. CC-YZS058]|uniref:DUF6894 family protein n=1 Tax=Rhizobium sp. CC-YZS058 TaxID=3042153 RepID=UPI002B058033|nr:hypothetical protein [Rhizobium sp. CC-YZS058]MEA3537020.1 hypothetical protein [Rhizobium sp. CC-YZS058]
MQRFFLDFHSQNVVTRDWEGMLLPDVAAATISATSSLRALAAEQLPKGERLLITAILIQDERRKFVGEVTIAEAVVPLLKP